MKRVFTLSAVAAVATAALLAGCATTQPLPVLKDGELATPADYKSWPKFLPTIDKEAAKQVREIYINTTGTKAEKGGAFPQGTRFVMEIYAAAEADGKLKKDANGRLVKGNLLHVYVMGKEPNWGTEGMAEAQRNGNWIYAAYKPDGTANPGVMGTCRGCHTPLGAKEDFVFHYDRYFAERKAAFTVEQIHAQAATSGRIADAQAVSTLAQAAR